MTLLDRYYCGMELQFLSIEMARMNALVSLAVVAEEDPDVSLDALKQLNDFLQRKYE